MEQGANLLQRETKQRIQYLSALLEPIMILCMALVVSFVIVGILIPVVTMMDMPL